MRIAFGGLMRSGKDTAAECLVDAYGGRILKFADPLYEILNYAQDVVGVEHAKDRNFLQWIGTDWARTTHGKDVWCNAFLKRLRKFEDLYPTENNYFISDVRFPNELETAVRAGFITVYINRPNKETDAYAGHASEAFLTSMAPSFDYIIHNEGSLEEFKKTILKLGYKNNMGFNKHE